MLDQSPISEGSTGAQALANTLDLARLADELGYHRYWVAEHHGTPALAGTSPEVLIGPIASQTSRMRVGSGGVILHHYSPRKVAESFSVLSGLFGDRIDLGVGRGMSGDPVTTHALQRDRREPSPDDFQDQLAELLAYIHDRPPPDERFAGLAPLPGLPGRPQPWLLGSSFESAIWAGELGLPYAFGDFINPVGVEIANLYRRCLADAGHSDLGRLAVCVAVICADTDEEAERLASSARMVESMRRGGTPIAVPPVEKAMEFFEASGPPTVPADRRAILGSPETVGSRMRELAVEYGADEVIVVTVTYAHEARRRSYQLIAEAFELGAAEAAARTG